MTKDGKEKSFDLEERTARFGEEVIEFAKSLPVNSVTRVLVSQLVRAATSVGANYCEADDAETRNDFKHKIGLSKKRVERSKTLVEDGCEGGARIQGRSREALERS